MNYAQISDLIETYYIEILLGLIIMNLLLLTVIIFLGCRNKKLHSNYKKLFSETTGQPLEEKIIKLFQEAGNNAEQLLQLNREIAEIKKQMKDSIQRVGVVKYNAFEDMGSDLSYAVALLNEYGTGVVMSSLYSREDFRAFAKIVKNGVSENRLTAEEQKAINIAMGK